MRNSIFLIAVLLASCAVLAAEPSKDPEPNGLIARYVDGADLAVVSPPLARCTREQLLGDLWRRPGLAPRDRAMATLTVAIARGQASELAPDLALALDNGVTPAEVSEILAHLAFYAGWDRALAAVGPIETAFAQRKIGPDRLAPVVVESLAIDEASESKRAASVQAGVGPVAPGLVRYTDELLFHDLWLRPGLTPRDRSLVTVSALIATGQLGQLGGHLARAMDNGMTRGEVAELLTHLAFYAGWPTVFSAVPIAKTVFESRPR